MKGLRSFFIRSGWGKLRIVWAMVLISGCNGIPITLLPVADAGEGQTVAMGQTVTLDGTGSFDPTGQEITFLWTQIAGEFVALSDPTIPNPTFTAPETAQTLTFRLTVTNEEGQTARDNVSVFVTTDVAGPVADAGFDQIVFSEILVQLNGTRSFDPGGRPLTFSWTQIAGFPVLLFAEDTALPTFIAPGTVGPLTFQLTVSDPQGRSSSDTVTVTVQAESITDPIDPFPPPF